MALLVVYLGVWRGNGYPGAVPGGDVPDGRLQQARDEQHRPPLHTGTHPGRYINPQHDSLLSGKGGVYKYKIMPINLGPFISAFGKIPKSLGGFEIKQGLVDPRKSTFWKNYFASLEPPCNVVINSYKAIFKTNFWCFEDL